MGLSTWESNGNGYKCFAGMGMGMGVGLTLVEMGKNGKAESHCRTLLNTSRPTSSSHNAVSKQLDDPLADSSLNDIICCCCCCCWRSAKPINPWWPNHKTSQLAVYLSGNALVSINVVTLRWAQLVPKWVTVFGQVNYLCNQPSRSTQLGHPSVGRRMSTSVGRLGR